MERLKTSKVSASNGNLKYPMGKSIFAANLPLKLFHSTISSADTGSPKSLYALFDAYLDYMLEKFEPNRIVRNIPNLSFWIKK